MRDGGAVWWRRGRDCVRAGAGGGYVFAHTYVCIYIHTCMRSDAGCCDASVCVCVCVFVGVGECMYEGTCVCVSRKGLCLCKKCVCVCMYVWVYERTCVCVYLSNSHTKDTCPHTKRPHHVQKRPIQTQKRPI